MEDQFRAWWQESYGWHVGALATPKPDIIPKPQFPSPRKIREDFLP